MSTLLHEKNSEIVPFFFLDKHELLDLNGIELPSQLKLLGSYELNSRLKTMPNLHDYVIDENLIHIVNSNYYDVTTFAQIQKARDSLSLFHTNRRSLSAHFDELKLLLTALKTQFDVIGISETREQAKDFSEKC